MTTRERILTLADGGHEAHMIAALLGLEVSDVVATLAEPGHTPQNPGQVVLFNAHLAVFAQGAPTTGGDTTLWLPSTTTEGASEVLTNVLTPPQTVPAGKGCGWFIDAPIFSSGSLELRVCEFEMANTDGTQKLSVESVSVPVALTSATKYSPNMEEENWRVKEAVGEDLKLVGNRLVSTAGGQFVCCLLGGFGCTGLRP